MNKKQRFVISLFSFILLGVFASQSWFLVKKTWITSKIFRRAGYSYSRVQDMAPSFQRAKAVRNSTPPQARMQYVGPKDLDYVTLRYAIYPRRIAEQGEYLLMRGAGRLPLRFFKGTSWTLPGGGQLCAAEGHSFIRQAPEAQRPLGVKLAVFVWTSACYILAGILCLRAMGFRCAGTDRIWYLSTSFLLGYAILNAGVWIFLMCQGRFTSIAVLILWGGLLAILAVLGRVFGTKEPNACPAKDRRPVSRRGWNVGANLVFGVITVAIIAITVQRPVMDWDPMSHWLLKAKVFFYQRGLSFADTHVNIYPLLWPLNIASQFMLLGEPVGELAPWNAAIFFLIFVIQMRMAMKILKIPALMINLGMALFLVSVFHNPFQPWWQVHFIAANAENAFLAYLAGLTVLLLMWLRPESEGKLWPVLAVLALGLSLVKMEGLIAVVIMVFAVLTSGRSGMSGAKKVKTVLVVLPAGLAWLAWSIWLTGRADVALALHLGSPVTFKKILWLAWFNVRHLFANNVFLLLALGWGAVRYRGCRAGRPEQRMLLMSGVVLLLFGCFATMGWPIAKLHAEEEVFHRLYLHAWPLLFLYLSSRCFRQRPITNSEAC